MSTGDGVSQPMSNSAAAPIDAAGADSLRLSASALEADVAYFDARLSLLSDEPLTRYQRAQLKTYRTLEKLLSDKLVGLGLNRDPRSDQNGD